MGKILCLETSTSVCSVAYCEKGEVVASEELFQVNSHASHLTVLIQKLFDREDTPSLQEIDAVAVCSGPGSYTGLRIGVSTAKGICFALDKPLIAIDSMEVLTYPIPARFDVSDSTLYCPLMDARRMEVYTALYNDKMEVVEAISAKIVGETTFSELLDKRQLVFFGNGADKCKDVIKHSNAVFLDDCHPLAKQMAQPAWLRYQNKQFEDVAYFEPFYLKDFVATTPKKKVL